VKELTTKKKNMGRLINKVFVPQTFIAAPSYLYSLAMLIMSLHNLYDMDEIDPGKKGLILAIVEACFSFVIGITIFIYYKCTNTEYKQWKRTLIYLMLCALLGIIHICVMEGIKNNPYMRMIHNIVALLIYITANVMINSFFINNVMSIMTTKSTTS